MDNHESEGSLFQLGNDPNMARSGWSLISNPGWLNQEIVPVNHSLPQESNVGADIRSNVASVRSTEQPQQHHDFFEEDAESDPEIAVNEDLDPSDGQVVNQIMTTSSLYTSLVKMEDRPEVDIYKKFLADLLLKNRIPSDLGNGYEYDFVRGLLLPPDSDQQIIQKDGMYLITRRRPQQYTSRVHLLVKKQLGLVKAQRRQFDYKVCPEQMSELAKQDITKASRLMILLDNHLYDQILKPRFFQGKLVELGNETKKKLKDLIAHFKKAKAKNMSPEEALNDLKDLYRKRKMRPPFTAMENYWSILHYLHEFDQELNKHSIDMRIQNVAAKRKQVRNISEQFLHALKISGLYINPLVYPCPPRQRAPKSDHKPLKDQRCVLIEGIGTQHLEGVNTSSPFAPAAGSRIGS